MQFTVFRASEGYFNARQIEVKSIQDLEQLYRQYGKNELIIDFSSRTIRIYDSYLE